MQETKKRKRWAHNVHFSFANVQKSIKEHCINHKKHEIKKNFEHSF